MATTWNRHAVAGRAWPGLSSARGPKRGILQCVVVLLVLVGALAAAAAPLRIAVASNFHAAYETLRPRLDADAEAAFGSSGLLYAQIMQGRPFDLFLSADGERPLALVTAGRAFGAAVYARGILVLLVNEGTPGHDWLAADRRVAVANAATAPYGRAAREALTALQVRPKLVNAFNVAQAFHFAASGAADGAFVALAQVQAQGIEPARYWIVPDHLHAPVEQVAVVVRGGREAAAAAWLGRLLDTEAQTLIQSAGYRAPSQPARQDQAE